MKSSPGRISSIAIAAVAVMLPNILLCLCQFFVLGLVRVWKERDGHLEEEGGDGSPHEISHLSHHRKEVRKHPYHVDHQAHHKQQRLLAP